MNVPQLNQNQKANHLKGICGSGGSSYALLGSLSALMPPELPVQQHTWHGE